MKNKKGFTLIEILAVVAILGILSLIAVPNVLKYLNESRKRAMITQENTILDAANLYITDYCSSTKLHDGMCPDSYENNEEGNEKYICLSDLQNTSNSYADTVKYKGKECKGIIVYDGKYPKGKTYLYCGDDGNYDYITDSSLNPAMYSRCGIVLDSEIYIFQIMDSKLSIMQEDFRKVFELAVSLANGALSSEQEAESIKEMKDLVKQANEIYNFEYANSKLLQKNNELSGKYVSEDVSSSGLKLDQLTYSDFSKDIDIINNAEEKIADFRSYIAAKQNAWEYNNESENCGDKSCKLKVANTMIARIQELAYMTAYGTDSDNERNRIDMEVQEYFNLLNTFAKSLGDNAISKNSVFPNGKDVKTVSNAKVVYDDAVNYFKNNSVDYKSNASTTWKNRVSMLQTAKGGLEQVVQISSRISELLNSCSNPTNSSDDKKLINDEIVQLIQEIDATRTTTSFNNIPILSDSSTYKDYMIYDLSDSNLESISCTSYNSNYLKYAESYKRKMDLNIVSIDANILESGELAGFIECADEDCVKTIIRNILTYMLQDANNAINVTDLKREEYNIEYTTFFKALNHIAEISENSSYSTSSLKLDSTNLTTSSNATNAKTLITNIISNLG